ncbi:MAG UNVERIFIED_CONTAM: hypothetical protein LOD86_05930 [Thermobifida fusca]
MARSKRARKKAPTTLAALVERLPDRFYEPVITEDLLGSLRAYLDDLMGWLADQGVRPDRAKDTALDIMAEIGASPAEWYRQAMERPQ